jgi:hypothetical protein
MNIVFGFFGEGDRAIYAGTAPTGDYTGGSGTLELTNGGTVDLSGLNNDADGSDVTAGAIDFIVLTGGTDLIINEQTFFEMGNAAGTITGSGNNTVTVTSSTAGTDGVNDVTLDSSIEQFNLTETSDVNVTISNAALTTTTTFQTVNAGAGDDQLIMNGGLNRLVNGQAGNDDFVVNAGDYTGSVLSGNGDDDQFFLSGAITGGTLNGGTANDEVLINNTTDLVGGTTLDGGAGADDEIIFTGGVSDITGGTFSNWEEVIFNNAAIDVTMTVGQYNQLVDGGLTFTQLGGNTDTNDIIRLENTATGNVFFTNDFTQDGVGEFGTLVLESTGNDTVNFDLEFPASPTNRTLDISAGGDDQINFNNVAQNNANTDDDRLIVVGFEAGNGGDIMNVVSEGQQMGLVYETVPASSNGVVSASDGMVLEVTGVSVSTVGAFDLGNGGAVEGVIAAAVGNINAGSLAAAGDSDFLVILYDNNNNAYLYSVDVSTVDNNLQEGDFQVELITEFNGIAVDAFDAGNFI